MESILYSDRVVPKSYQIIEIEVERYVRWDIDYVGIAVKGGKT